MNSLFYYIKHYLRFKGWFWLILFFAFEAGALSKYYHLSAAIVSYRSPLWMVIINAAIGLICLGVFFRIQFQKQPEQSSQHVKNGRLVMFFTILGGLSGAAILPYLMNTIGTQKIEQQLHVPFTGLLAISAFSVACMTLIVSWIGLDLAGKVGLDLPILRRWLYEGMLSSISKKWLAISVFGSFMGTLVMGVLETFFFQPNLPQLPTTPELSLLEKLSTVLYGGIVEEVLLRLFFMTLLVWLLSRFSKSRTGISPSIYWIAIFLSTIIFGLGHLPAVASLYGGVTPLLVIRAVINNGLGVWFGLLFWKKGFEYAILAHMSADLFLQIIMVPLFSMLG